MQEEIWHKTEFEYYEISENLLVRSLPRYKKTSTKVIKQTIGKRGYYEVCIFEKKQRKTVKLHRLIAKTFIPNPYNLPEVNHIDANKLNNQINNLEWCNRKYNVRHAVSHGLFDGRNYNGISTKVKSISVLSGEERYFDSFREASNALNVNYSSIPRVISGEYKQSNNYKFELIS